MVVLARTAGNDRRWDPHPYGLCLGAPHILTLPPLARDVPPGPYWLRPSVSDRLVPPVPLRGLRVSSTVQVGEVTPEDIDERVAGTVHLFQQRVDKAGDVRVTVIGERVFCVRIDCGLLDWRTDYGRLRYSVVEPPAGIADALHRYLARFGLGFRCFRLRHRPGRGMVVP